MRRKLINMGRALRVILVGAVCAAVTAGCHRTFSTEVTQPNPLKQPLETLRVSEEVVIVTGDMELSVPRHAPAAGGTVWQNQRYPLMNKAQFMVVSRDRLRFHVQIEHKWEDWANVTTWDAELVDDQGRKYRPKGVDLISDKHIVHMWDYEKRSVVRNRYGDVVGMNNDGHKDRQPLASLSLFRGKGDFVFFSRDIFTPDVKSLTLRLKRRGLSYQFTWNFTDEGAAPGDGTATAMR